MGPVGKTVVRVGSRRSQLALHQTHLVIDKLLDNYPDIDFQVVKIATIGDKILDVALSKIGDKNIFTKELEQALHAKEVDFVVHSLKDVPTILPDNLVLGCITSRLSPFDVVLMSPANRGKTLSTLPPNSIIGTSALRRIAILSRKYPYLKFLSVRGNLSTRLRKLDISLSTTNDASIPHYDALILAEAGVLRLGWENRIDETLKDDRYAVGQGALACECRQGDIEMQRILASIHDEPAALACIAERSFMCCLEGGCSTPIGVRTTLLPGGVAGVESEAGRPQTLTLDAAVLSLDGSECVTGNLTAALPTAAPIKLTESAAKTANAKMLVTGNKRNQKDITYNLTGDAIITQSAKIPRYDVEFLHCQALCSKLSEDQSSAELEASLDESTVILGLNVFPTCLVARLRMVRARRLGEQLAKQLLDNGADEILNKIKSIEPHRETLTIPITSDAPLTQTASYCPTSADQIKLLLSNTTQQLS